ncbi:MAG TPA: hypothetical protein VNG51_25755 [Ktedonobacteraceae bacterium]|nr:hypothetical protein [Ktedonobacteraceae bacterium]
MLPEPEYAQNIIVGVLFHNTFVWYVTEREYWVLDRIKNNRAMLESGYARLISKNYADRFHIAVLDEHTAERFLSAIADKRVPASALSQMMLEREASDEDDDLLDFAPCLLVNIDQRQFSSQYPEPIRFERYVPDGWTGAYRSFLSEVPEEERYWIVDGKDLFKSEKSS